VALALAMALAGVVLLACASFTVVAPRPPLETNYALILKGLLSHMHETTPMPFMPHMHPARIS
jgi:hypothetical protein